MNNKQQEPLKVLYINLLARELRVDEITEGEGHRIMTGYPIGGLFQNVISRCEGILQNVTKKTLLSELGKVIIYTPMTGTGFAASWYFAHAFPIVPQIIMDDAVGQQSILLWQFGASGTDWMYRYAESLTKKEVVPNPGVAALIDMMDTARVALKNANTDSENNS